jgi:hypothetical protein
MVLYEVPLPRGRTRVVEITLLAVGGGSVAVYILGPRGGQESIFYGADAKQARGEAARLRERASELEDAAREIESNRGPGVI